MDLFIIKAFIGGLGISILTSIVGCFVLWKKMAYLGDSLSHSVLLGITLSVIFNIDILLGSFIFAIIFAFILFSFMDKFDISTILGIIAHSGIAVSVLILSFIKNIRVDLMGYLFGDILTITRTEIYLIFSLIILVSIWLSFNWKKFILTAISNDLAKSEGINTRLLDLQMILLMSLIIVASVKIVGVLLVTAMLLIPAACARNFANTPVQMIFIAIIFGSIFVCLGLFSSLKADTPSGPAIIVIGLLSFLISFIFKKEN